MLKLPIFKFLIEIFFIIFREKAKSYGSNKSGSNQIVPEVEHILQQSHPTDVHDLGTHTVSVTHLDFSKVSIYLVMDRVPENWVLEVPWRNYFLKIGHCETLKNHQMKKSLVQLALSPFFLADYG